MGPTPTGRVLLTGDGYDLAVERTLPSPPEQVWATLTEPDRTAQWFGVWKGEPGEGRTVHVRSGFEEGTPWNDVLIRTCRPPAQLGVAMGDEAGAWVLDVTLAPVAGGTQVTLTHHLPDAAMVGDIGPGWEYYLDMFVAAHSGGERPDFADYHPSQAAWFTDQVA